MTSREFRKINKNLEVTWVDPYPGLTKSRKDITIPVTNRATIRDCIALQRNSYKTRIELKNLTDYTLFMDFLVVNWATIRKD